MSETLRQLMPNIYDRLLPPLFDELAPEEPKATCSSCSMCPPKEPLAAVTYFRPDTKCCTYEPSLPNYLVGAILADVEPAMAEGQRRIREHIASRVGVTSRWLAPSRKRRAIFHASRGSSFGRSTTLLCPYYQADGGLCTIWRHRESVCSTFFCKYAAGADGQTFWRSVEGYMRQVERALASHAVNLIEPTLAEPARGPSEMSLEELEDRPPSDAEYATFWGAYRGREEEVYGRAFEIVRALTSEEVQAIAGADEALAALTAAHDTLVHPQLPEKLRLDLYRPPMASTSSGVIVGTYSNYEPIELTPDLYEVLKEMREDETVSAFRSRMLRDHEVDVPEALLLDLHRLRVLI